MSDPAKLLLLLKRERRVELSWEGLRYWDLIRWGEAVETLDNKPQYGIFLTSDPANYKRFPVGPSGHYFVINLKFKAANIPWPFPQDELDINTSMRQKDNWK